MIETRRLKYVVIFIQTVLSFMLSRKIINIDNDIAWKYGNTYSFYIQRGGDHDLSFMYEIILNTIISKLRSGNQKSFYLLFY